MQVAKAQALEQLEGENQIQAMLPIKNPMYTEGDSTVAQEQLRNIYVYKASLMQSIKYIKML